MRTAEVERRALALFEHLADDPENTRLRKRFLKNEAPAVVARVEALIESARKAESSIPTLIPGAASADDMPPPPERVGPFRLTTRIGRGGMGDVWAGERADGLYDQKVAIKLIQRHAIARAAAAFDDERRFLAKLEHPNIARLIDGGVTEDGLPWLAMEFIDGQQIDEAGAALPLPDRVRNFVKAADAVHYAHSRMVAHADLKPGNILVDGEGRVKLLDFGISGLIGQGGASVTGSGPLTREFASPQRIAGAGPSVPDDIYALGKTLALVLAGSEANEELAAIAHKASEEREEDRYASVTALIADLDLWRTNRPVVAMHDGLAYRAQKFVERHRFGVAAASVAALALAGTGIFATANYFRAETASERSTQRLQEVRQLARYMLFDLHDDLARQPGTLKKRVEIATVAARYLDQLRTAKDAPPELRLEVAQGYRRLATIQGMGAGLNLGDADAARQTMEQARKLLDEMLATQPRNAPALAQRGWIELGLWTLGADNIESVAINDRARSLLDKALAIDSTLAEARLD
jgi:eukaryotic-like serine/threonine-protein kinase